MPGTRTSGNRTARRGHPSRLRRRITKDTARYLDALAAEWDVDADALLSIVVKLAPLDLFQAAAETIRQIAPPHLE